MISRSQIFAFLLIFAFWTQAFSQTGAVPAGAFSRTESEIAAGITVASIKEATAALSAPDMLGRGTLQPGGEKAAAWIADRFKKLGLKPLGDKGSFFQSVEFKESTATSETSFKIGDDMGWRISQSDSMPSWLATSRFAKLERGNPKQLPEEK